MLAISSLGHAAGAQDFLAVVDVVEEGVERLDALLDALRQPPPFGAGDDARHDVEGDQPLGGLLLAIDGEGDAGLAEDTFGVPHLFGEPGRILLLQPAGRKPHKNFSDRISPASFRRTQPIAILPCNGHFNGVDARKASAIASLCASRAICGWQNANMRTTAWRHRERLHNAMGRQRSNCVRAGNLHRPMKPPGGLLRMVS